MSKRKNRVLLIGWDAADWKVIDKLMAEGRMPAMKKFLEGGVRGRLATLDPPLSPMLWTSIATGMRPFKHGISGFVEPDPENGYIRPVSSRSRKVKAIWNILTQEQKRSIVVGWWPSNPVEPINGCMVSNFYHQEKKGKETVDPDKWDMPAGTVHPEEWADRLKALRVHPNDITGNLLMPFVPQAIELDKKEDVRLLHIAKFLAHATSVHAAHTELMDNEEWDFCAVYHDAIDHFSHAFMKFHPPQMSIISDEDYNLFKDVVTGVYVFHDMMLERLLQLVDDDTTVIICSDHGFHSDHLRPKFLPQVPSGPAVEHADYGIFAAKGPGIKKGETIYGASILDITPTLLNMFNLPVGEDMDGRVLSEIYTDPVPVKKIESWEKVKGDSGELATDFKQDPYAEAAALEQLVELGYIDKPDADKEKVLKENIRENNLYMAKSLSHAGKYEEAFQLLSEQYDGATGSNFRFVVDLANLCLKTNRFEEGRKYIDILRDTEIINKDYLNILEAKFLFRLNDVDAAIRLLNQSYESLSDTVYINIELGKIYNVLRNTDKAVTCFKRAIDLDPQNAYAHHGLGLAKLRNEQYEDAVEHFLDSINIQFYYPYAHFHLGEALALMGETDAAISAFTQTNAMLPNMIKPVRWLADLHKIKGHTELESAYRKQLEKITLGHLTILTGVPGPRLQAFSKLYSGNDDELSASAMYGLEETDVSLKRLENSKGKTIFVPLKSLGSLSAKFDYDIVFVEDSLDESREFYQKALGNVKSDTYDLGAADAIRKQLYVARIWIDQQPDLNLHYVDVNNTESVQSGLEVANTTNKH